MTAAAIDHHHAKASPIDVLRARAEAKVLLIHNGYYQDFQSAVDELWAAAERDGLVEKFGVDEIQRVLSESFARWQQYE